MEHSSSSCKEAGLSLFALRIAYGLMLLAFGVDKFFNILSPWGLQLHARAHALFMGLSSTHVLYGIGVVDIAIAGLLLFWRSRLGGYLAMVGFLLAGINFYMLGAYATAIRSIVLAVGGLVIACNSCSK